MNVSNNVSTIAADTTAAIADRNATTQDFNNLKSEDFFALMIQQLQSQDPLNPQDTGQLLQQLSSIRSIEQSATTTSTLQSLASSLQNLTNGRAFGDPSSLIGTFIAGTTTNQAGETVDVQGVVVGFRFEGNGQAILELHNGQFLPAQNVDQVTLVENLPPDLRDQIQNELGGLNGNGNDTTGDSTGDTTGTGDMTGSGDSMEGNTVARRILRDLTTPMIPFQAGKTNRVDYKPSIGTNANPRRSDLISALLDSLSSPGVEVGVGL